MIFDRVVCIRAIFLISLHVDKGVVHKLIPGLEKHRNAELAERKEKRKKQHGSEKENEKDGKDEKERLNTTECMYILSCAFLHRNPCKCAYIALKNTLDVSAGSSSLIQMDEQRSSASTSQRNDATPLIAGEETTVETTRQERTPEEDIIGIFAILERKK